MESPQVQECTHSFSVQSCQGRAHQLSDKVLPWMANSCSGQALTYRCDGVPINNSHLTCHQALYAVFLRSPTPPPAVVCLCQVKGARQVKKTILGLQAHNQQTAQDIQQQQIRQRQELFLLQANAPEAYEALQQQQQQQQLLGDDHQVHHQQQIISDLSAQALQDYKQDLEQQKKRHIIVAKWLSELHSLWQQSEPPSEVHASQMIGSYQAALLFSTKYKEIVDDLVRQQQQVVQVTSRPAVMSRAADSPVAGSITAADSTSAVGDMAPNGSTSAVPAEGSNSCSTSAGSTAAAAAGGSTIGSTVGGRRRSTTTKTSAAASAVPPLGSRNGSSSNRSSSSGADVCASTVATWPAAKNVKAQEAVVKREFEAWHNNRAAVLRSMKVRELQVRGGGSACVLLVLLFTRDKRVMQHEGAWQATAA